MVASRQSLLGELVLVVVWRRELSNTTSWCRVKRRDSREADLTAEIPTPDIPPGMSPCRTEALQPPLQDWSPHPRLHRVQQDRKNAVRPRHLSLYSRR